MDYLSNSQNAQKFKCSRHLAGVWHLSGSLFLNPYDFIHKIFSLLKKSTFNPLLYIHFSGTKIDLKSMSLTSLTRKRKTTMKSCQFQWLPSTWCLLKVWISKAILNFNVFKSCKGGLILESIFTLVSSSKKSEKSMLGTVISHNFFWELAEY